MLTYTLVAGIDLLEAVRRYGLVGRTGTVPDAAGLPFTLHERSEQLAGGPITFIELGGRRLLADRGWRARAKCLLCGARSGVTRRRASTPAHSAAMSGPREPENLGVEGEQLKAVGRREAIEHLEHGPR